MRRFLPLAFGLFALTAAVMALALWAVLGGVAGTQRGLIIRNASAETVVLTFEDGQSATVDPTRQATFVLKREDFPQKITATSNTGVVVASREFTYAEIADAEFRWDLDGAGFFPTQEVRTVVP